MKGFVVGILMGMALLAGSVYYYFVSGMAPAAVADPPMLMEHKIASKSLNAHIDKANLPSAPPIQPSDENYVAGAKAYKDQCAVCHGLPNQPAPLAENMFPHAPLLFKGKGVTDDPPQESYWKVKNGIRLTGMPTFSGILDDNKMWQVALLVANADKIPDSAKKLLVPDAAPAAAAMPAMPAAPVSKK